MKETEGKITSYREKQLTNDRTMKIIKLQGHDHTFTAFDDKDLPTMKENDLVKLKYKIRSRNGDQYYNIQEAEKTGQAETKAMDHESKLDKKIKENAEIFEKCLTQVEKKTTISVTDQPDEVIPATRTLFKSVIWGKP